MDDVVEAPEQDVAQDQPEPFGESGNFDPQSLPDEVRPAYDQLRADYTRKTQSLAEQRREVERQQQEYQQAVELLARVQQGDREALGLLGLELDGDEPDDVAPDPYSELEQIKEYLAEQESSREQEAQYQEVVQYTEDALSYIERETGSQLDDVDREQIVAFAIQRQADDGMPDMEYGFERFLEAQERAQRRWLESKRSHRPVGGVPGSQKLDLSDETQRQQYMASLVEAGG